MSGNPIPGAGRPARSGSFRLPRRREKETARGSRVGRRRKRWTSDATGLTSTALTKRIIDRFKINPELYPKLSHLVARFQGSFRAQDLNNVGQEMMRIMVGGATFRFGQIEVAAPCSDRDLSSAAFALAEVTQINPEDLLTKIQSLKPLATISITVDRPEAYHLPLPAAGQLFALFRAPPPKQAEAWWLLDHGETWTLCRDAATHNVSKEALQVIPFSANDPSILLRAVWDDILEIGNRCLSPKLRYRPTPLIARLTRLEQAAEEALRDLVRPDTTPEELQRIGERLMACWEIIDLISSRSREQLELKISLSHEIDQALSATIQDLHIKEGHLLLAARQSPEPGRFPPAVRFGGELRQLAPRLFADQLKNLKVVPIDCGTYSVPIPLDVAEPLLQLVGLPIETLVDPAHVRIKYDPETCSLAATIQNPTVYYRTLHFDGTPLTLFRREAIQVDDSPGPSVPQIEFSRPRAAPLLLSPDDAPALFRALKLPPVDVLNPSELIGHYHPEPPRLDLTFRGALRAHLLEHKKMSIGDRTLTFCWTPQRRWWEISE